jgi:beta-N-acetylhexosaminidase
LMYQLGVMQMKKHVKLTALLFAVSLILSGCGGKTETNSNTAVTSENVVSEVQQGNSPVENAPQENNVVDSQPDEIPPVVPDGEVSQSEVTISPESSDKVETILNALDLKRKVYQLFIITPEALTGNPQVVAFGELSQQCIQEKPVGGLIYFSPNLENRDQAKEMLHDTQDFTQARTKVGLFMAVDEEGGTVARVADNLNTTPIQPMQSYGRRNDTKEVRAVGETIGNDIKEFCFNLDFAPVADLSVTAGGIGADASYGDDASAVTPYVTAMADGLSGSGVIPAYKYFPSLAASTQDPRLGRALSDRTLEDFRGNEFQIWLSAINAGAQMIQMSNVIYPSIDSDSLPSSLSEKCVTGVLRDELKYDGVIISGPLSDAAISEYYTASESAVMALKAGCDMIYSSPDPRAAVSGIMDGVSSGVISEDRIDDALIRIYRIRYADRLSELRAQYEADAAALGVDLTGVAY